MVNWIKPFVPAKARPLLRRAWDRTRYWGLRHQCPVCTARLRTLLPWGDPEDVNFLCPVCRSKPPHRLAALFFQLNSQKLRPGGRVVHVAPEPELQKRLCRWAVDGGMEYRSGGITGQGEQYLDLRQLPFPDGSVDLLYCCHVLNSMREDRRAMAEVFRVLHPRGTALLQVPAYCQGAATIEPTSRAERLAAFHDDEIYRCYTPDDYVNRLRQTGFAVECFRSADLPAQLVERCELKGEVLHICSKSQED